MFVGSQFRFTLPSHARSPSCGCAPFAVIDSRWYAHPQQCAYSGRTTAKPVEAGTRCSDSRYVGYPRLTRGMANSRITAPLTAVIRDPDQTTSQRNAQYTRQAAADECADDADNDMLKLPPLPRRPAIASITSYAMSQFPSFQIPRLSAENLQ